MLHCILINWKIINKFNMNGSRTKRELSITNSINYKKKKISFHWFQPLVSKLKLFVNFIVKILITYSGSFSCHKYFRSKTEFIRLSSAILSRFTSGKNSLNWIFCYAARQLAMSRCYWPSSSGRAPIQIHMFDLCSVIFEFLWI